MSSRKFEKIWDFSGRIIWNIFILIMTFLMGGMVMTVLFGWNMGGFIFILPQTLCFALIYSTIISSIMYYAEGKPWYNNKITIAFYLMFLPLNYMGLEILCKNIQCYI